MVKINLENQTLEVPSEKILLHFDINPYKKECLLKGLDDIDYLLSVKDKIHHYELKKP
jgi:3-isopropylmalate/(R)-2-methylmalate dehydratase small subunit